jgi:hypothetical protein
VPVPPLVLAHYGGVPEALTVALPVVVFAGFMLAERRARRRDRERAQLPEQPPARPHGQLHDRPRDEWA